MRSRIRRTVVVVAACAIAAGSAGQAAADGAPRWEPRGEAVTGTEASTAAPMIGPGASYKDTLGPGESKYYAITLDTKSTAYLSAFMVPGPGARVAHNDGVDLVLESTDGTECDSSAATFGADMSARPVGNAVVRDVHPDADCRTAGPYTLKVARVSAATSEPADWPIEIRYLSEPGLRSGQKAGPAVGHNTEPPVPAAGGETKDAAGGTSFETAAPVKSGVWKDQVLPGETRFYKVPVDWGQQAVFVTDFGNKKTKTAGDYALYGLRVEGYTPARAELGTKVENYNGKQTSVSTVTPPVGHANRLEDDELVSAARTAGWYYYAVSVHPAVGEFITGAVPVSLRVEVKGEAEPAPPYDGDAAAAGFGITDDDIDDADGTATSGSDSALRLAAFAALGAGTALVLTLVVWLVVARRRAATRPVEALPSDPTGYGPPPAW